MANAGAGRSHQTGVSWDVCFGSEGRHTVVRPGCVCNRGFQRSNFLLENSQPRLGFAPKVDVPCRKISAVR